MGKARELLDEMGIPEFDFDVKKNMQDALKESELGDDGKGSPYRDKFGFASNAANAVLVFDINPLSKTFGQAWKTKGKSGKKGGKVNLDKCGRSARDDDKNVRCHDGAKDPEPNK